LKRKEASLAVKGRILIFLQKSIKASNQFPSFLQVIFDCLYGQTTTKKLKQAGMGFAHWVCRMAEQQTLIPVAPVLLSGLLKLIKEEPPSLDLVDENIRGFNFVAISTLCKRGKRHLPVWCASLMANTCFVLLFFSHSSETPS